MIKIFLGVGRLFKKAPHIKIAFPSERLPYRFRKETHRLPAGHTSRRFAAHHLPKANLIWRPAPSPTIYRSNPIYKNSASNIGNAVIFHKE